VKVQFLHTADRRAVRSWGKLRTQESHHEADEVSPLVEDGVAAVVMLEADGSDDIPHLPPTFDLLIPGVSWPSRQ
jgi:hypothetical protein